MHTPCFPKVSKRLEDVTANTQAPLFSAIPITHFYGIEIADFAAETAKLALFIAEYQANAAFAEVFGRRPAALPLKDAANIRTGNALREDWEQVCPPPMDGQEVFIAGNPPFLGKAQQDAHQKADMDFVFAERVKTYRAFDLVAAWYYKAAAYIRGRNAQAALVSTNSICQGASAANLWPHILYGRLQIGFARQSFKWRNNASANAAVICVIVGLRNVSTLARRLFDGEHSTSADNINAYLIDAADIYVTGRSNSAFGLPPMDFGCMPYDAGNLLMNADEREAILVEARQAEPLIRRFMGSQEVVKGIERFCLWISDDSLPEAMQIAPVARRIEATRVARLQMKDAGGQALAARPHQFREHVAPKKHAILIPSVTSERRPYLPVEKVGADVISSNLNQVLYDAPDWCISLIASRLHLVWIATVCGKLKSDFRYSNTLGWNTFPVPKFSDAQHEALSASALNILKCRWSHYPKTIADLYDPDKMPDDLRAVHCENDELLETMYIGRPFRNDTERLEKLFKLYAARIKAVGAKGGR